MVNNLRNKEKFDQLCRLEEHLGRSIPCPEEVYQQINVETGAYDSFFDVSGKRKYRMLEQSFMTRFITPKIHEFIQSECNFSGLEASERLISEYRLDKRRGFSHPKFTTSYPAKLPFMKALDSSAIAVRDKWRNQPDPLHSQHPDVLLRMPFPMILEAKFFESGGVDRASTEIVKIIYECFFYLGLANRSETVPPWDYEFACALIYDHTGASVRTAWGQLGSDLRKAIWNTANVFVMILSSRVEEN